MMIPRRPSLAVSPRRLCAALAMAALLPAGLASAQETSGDTWIGAAIGVAKPALAYLGRSPVVEPDSSVADSLVSSHSPARPAATAAGKPVESATGSRDTVGFVVVDATTGDTFSLTAPRADLDRLHQEMMMRGQTLAGGEAKDEAAAASSTLMQAVSARSWSDGIPNFIRRGIADGVPANHDVYRRIGQIGSGCSGTLIGPRHVLTAAHCLVNNLDFTVYNGTFRPRRDWTEGTPSPTQPFGSRALISYVIPQEYWNGTCNFADGGYDCNKYDIGVGILSSNIAVPYMGYGYAPIATLNTWNKYMRGYPRCFTTDEDGDIVPDAEAPPNCTRSTLYGDRSACHIGDWSSLDADGWNRELWVDCDGARGMSGSALYTADSPIGLIALGVYSQFVCTAAACANDPNGDYPNTFTRITPEWATMISMAKSMWSCPSGPCNEATP